MIVAVVKFVGDIVNRFTKITYDRRYMWLFHICFILLLIQIGYLGQQIVTRKHNEPLYLKAQLKPGSLLFWDGSFDGHIPDDFAEPKISANDFTFTVWNDATLSLALFANPDKSLKCGHDQTLEKELEQLIRNAIVSGHNQIGDDQILEDTEHIPVPTYFSPNLRSHYMRIYSTPPVAFSKTPFPTIYSKAPVTIKLDFNTNLGAIAFNKNGIDGIDLAYFRYLKDYKNVTLNPIYTFGYINGKEGSPFVVTADSKSKAECTGKFHEFKGMRTLTLPPKFIGKDSDGIIKLDLRSKSKTIESLVEGIFPNVLGQNDAEPIQGIYVSAKWNAKIKLRLPIKSISLFRLPMQFTFLGATKSVSSEDGIVIEFDNKSGRFVIEENEKTVEISGNVNNIYFNNNNITPRLIENWPLYMRIFFAPVMFFLITQSWRFWQKMIPAKQSLNSDDHEHGSG